MRVVSCCGRHACCASEEFMTEEKEEEEQEEKERQGFIAEEGSEFRSFVLGRCIRAERSL